MNEECNFATDTGLGKLENYFAQREKDLQQLSFKSQPLATPPSSTSTVASVFSTPPGTAQASSTSSVSPAGTSSDPIDGQLELITAGLASTHIDGSTDHPEKHTPETTADLASNSPGAGLNTSNDDRAERRQESSSSSDLSQDSLVPVMNDLPQYVSG